MLEVNVVRDQVGNRVNNVRRRVIRTGGQQSPPGDNVGRGSDDTLFATAAGAVKFGQRRGRRVVDVVPTA